jgi:hypothetical protein
MLLRRQFDAATVLRCGCGIFLAPGGVLDDVGAPLDLILREQASTVLIFPLSTRHFHGVLGAFAFNFVKPR